MTFHKDYISPAKINIGLSIPFRYPNGYHHIVSLFVPIDLCDRISISIEPAFKSKESKFHLTWENQMPAMFHNENTDRVFNERFQDNLMYKAYEWAVNFFNKRDIPIPALDFSVHIQKKIPSPAGLGGGSSNAAAVIRAFVEFVSENIAPPKSLNMQTITNELEKQCLEIGSDIPFFIRPGTSLVSGTGEIFKSLTDLPISGIMGIPQFGFATGEMYKALNKPACSWNRSQIMDFLSVFASTGDHLASKKALQGDKIIISSLITIHKNYLDFYEWLMCTGKDDKAGAENSDSNLIGKSALYLNQYLKKSKTCFVNNEFMDIARTLFPEKYSILDEMQKLAAEKVSQCVASHDTRGRLIASMSGSGAAIYAGLTGSQSLLPEFQTRLEKEVSSLQKERADVHWFKFCSTTK